MSEGCQKVNNSMPNFHRSPLAVFQSRQDVVPSELPSRKPRLGTTTIIHAENPLPQFARRPASHRWYGDPPAGFVPSPP